MPDGSLMFENLSTVRSVRYAHFRTFSPITIAFLGVTREVTASKSSLLGVKVITFWGQTDHFWGSN